MAVFIGISRRAQLQKLELGQKSFWCVQRARKVQSGDLLLLYFSSSVSPVRQGIRQIYRITSLRPGRGEGECNERNMVTIDTELLFNLDEGITIKDMKADEVVSQMGAVGRNMQGVTFTVSSEIWPALRELIINRNPKAESVLLL